MGRRSIGELRRQTVVWRGKRMRSYPFPTQPPATWGSGEPGTPRGKTVDSSLVASSQVAWRVARPGLAMINRVHGVDWLPLVIVSTSRLVITGHLDYVPPGQTPDRIVLPARRGRPRLSLAHEIGHVLDLVGHGRKGESSATHAFVWDRWRTAVLATDLYRALRPFLAHDEPAVRDQAAYSLQLDELWARSYAQYIAIRSGDARMAVELAGFFTQQVGEVELPRQWDEADFVPVMEAIDELFIALEWRS